MNHKSFAAVALSVLAAACATTPKAVGDETTAPNRASPPLTSTLTCALDGTLPDCLRDALVERKYDDVVSFCRQKLVEQPHEAGGCYVYLPIAYWMSAREQEADSFVRSGCRGVDLHARINFVVLTSVKHSVVMHRQGLGDEEVQVKLVAAVRTFAPACEAPLMAVAALMSEVGTVMTEQQTEWPKISCAESPGCLAALNK